MIFRSPYGQVTIPEVPLTPLVLRQAERLGQRPALIDSDSGRTITYAELSRSVRQAACGLAKLGVRKGDVFAILSPNRPEYVLAFHAVSTLGGIITPMNPLYTAEEIAHQLEDSGAGYLLTVPELMEKARQAAASANVKEIIVIGEGGGATSFDSLLVNDGHAPEASIRPREDLAALPYSSGTTGLPKGVMLTHYNLVANIIQMERSVFYGQDETLVCVLPLFHIYGLNVVMNAGLYSGATIVMIPRFELEHFLGVLQDHRVTLASVVPPIMLALAKHRVIDRYDLSSLKALFSGAAPLGPALSEECTTRLGCVIRQGYGMTEASPATHVTPHDPQRARPGSVGVCLPGTECKLVDPVTGAELDHDREGELWVRGPQVMKGYLNRPDETARTVDSEGWLHTGDIGYADRDGQFYIVDRVKELIKYKGLQVAPAELEAILLSHPAVADAAVIPSPDEEAGEVPKAFVVPRFEITGGEIMEFVARHVAPHKKIRKLEFIEQVPRSASGKILRRLLVERERASN